MTSANRIYRVTDEDGNHNLVRAISAAQAVRHVSEKKFDVAVASQDDLVALLPSTPVMDATAKTTSE